MDLKLLDDIDELVRRVKSDKRYQEYRYYKEKLENDESLILLVIKKEKYIDELTFLRRVDKDNIKKELDLLKKIKEVQEEINSLEIVKIYKEKEEEYNKIIDLINDYLFKI